MPTYAKVLHGALIGHVVTDGPTPALDEVVYPNPEEFYVLLPDGQDPWTIGAVDWQAERRRSAKASVRQLAFALDRRRAYLAAGVDTETMTIALWERVVENRPLATNQLQTLRDKIKARIPAPTLPVAR